MSVDKKDEETDLTKEITLLNSILMGLIKLKSLKKTWKNNMSKLILKCVKEKSKLTHFN